VTDTTPKDFGPKDILADKHLPYIFRVKGTLLTDILPMNILANRHFDQQKILANRHSGKKTFGLKSFQLTDILADSHFT
jgi:hypothetical protein